MDFFRHVDLRNFGYKASSFVLTARQWTNPLVFLDTEFPGTLYCSPEPYSALSLAQHYALLKRNADDLRLIQVGITLCHPAKKLAATWQFDIRDFHICCFAPSSVDLLRSSGIDVERTGQLGIPSVWLVRLLVEAGLMGRHCAATWVAFHGGNDFALLLKSYFQLNRPPWIMKDAVRLPSTHGRFMACARLVFGHRVYDLKCLAESCRLYGGLEKVAAQLKVKRAVGAAHQAGSDSFLTCEVFLKMKETHFWNGDVKLPHEGLLAGFGK